MYWKFRVGMSVETKEFLHRIFRVFTSQTINVNFQRTYHKISTPQKPSINQDYKVNLSFTAFHLT